MEVQPPFPTIGSICPTCHKSYVWLYMNTPDPLYQIDRWNLIHNIDPTIPGWMQQMSMTRRTSILQCTTSDCTGYWFMGCFQ